MSLPYQNDLYRQFFEVNEAIKLLIRPGDGLILDANPAAAKFYGYPREVLKRMTIFDINALPRDEVIRKMRSAKDGAQREFDFPHRLKSGEIRYVRVYSGPLRFEGEDLLYSIIFDVTRMREDQEALKQVREELERKVEERTRELSEKNQILLEQFMRRRHAEEDLRFERQQLLSIFDSIEAEIFVVDPRTVEFLFANRRLRQRMKTDDLSDSCYGNLFVRRKGRAPCQTLEDLRKQGGICHWEFHEPSRRVDCMITDTLIRWPDGRDALLELVVDITEQKEAERRLLLHQQGLRSLASELALAEERERRLIATELHDRVGQSLALAKIKLGALQQIDQSEKGLSAIADIRDLIEEMIQETRSLTFEISPPVLYELGLEAALEWLVESTRDRHGIDAVFHDDLEPKPVDDDIRILLFQATRELLLNVVKHAGAESIKVSFLRGDDSVMVRVKDDGEGFDPDALPDKPDRSGGFGLMSIRERLNYLGGSMEIESRPGAGTTTVILAPLKKDIQR